MQEDTCARWQKIWLNRGMTINQVAGTSMIEINGVQGFLIPGDVPFLFRLGETLPPGGNYLEIGSWMGLSSILVANGLLASLNLDGRVWCVDTWEGSPEHQTIEAVKNGQLGEIFRENIKSAALDHFIRPVRGRSVDIARSWAGPGLDIIFIDGDHSTIGCYEDIQAWLPRLRPGGRLLGHDASPGSGVRQALERYRAETGKGVQLFPPPTSHYAWEASL